MYTKYFISINYQSQPFYLSFQDLSEPPGILDGCEFFEGTFVAPQNPVKDKPREDLIPPNGWSRSRHVYVVYIYIYIL